MKILKKHYLNLICIHFISINVFTQVHDTDFKNLSYISQSEENILFGDSWEKGCWQALGHSGYTDGACKDSTGNWWKRSQMQGEYSGRVVPWPVRRGNYAMRYEWRPERYNNLKHQHSRNTLKKAMTHSGYAPDYNSERWYGFSVYFPSEGMKVDEGQMLFFQLHGTPDQELGESWRQPMAAMNIINGEITYSFTFDTALVSPGKAGNANIEKNRTTNPIGHVSEFYDKWTDFVWHCKLDPFGKGMLEIWINGKKIAEHKNIGFGYNDKVGSAQFSIGMYYYEGVAEHNHWLYYDEVRVGDENASYETVAPHSGKRHKIISVKANGFEGTEHEPATWCDDNDCDPEETVDGDFGKKSIWMWKREEEKKPWIQLDLGKEKKVDFLKIAYFKGHQRNYFFEIQAASEEHGEWKTIFSGKSSGATDKFEKFVVEATKARYIKIIGDGNTYEGEKDFANWTNIYEIEVWEE